MIPRRTAITIFALSLLLLGTLLASVPGAQAKEYKNTEVKKDDFWSKKIEKPEKKDDENWKYTISVDELNGKKFDVYILESAEFSKYKDDKAFSAEVSMENTTSTGRINFSVDWNDPDFYLVVDNKNNTNANDVYSNETITVKIKLEREEDEGLWLFICGGLCGLAVIAIIVIIVWIIVERKRPQKPYETFQPLKNPPLTLKTQPPASLESPREIIGPSEKKQK